jgi:hypothetical protein
MESGFELRGKLQQGRDFLPSPAVYLRGLGGGSKLRKLTLNLGQLMQAGQMVMGCLPSPPPRVRVCAWPEAGVNHLPLRLRSLWGFCGKTKIRGEVKTDLGRQLERADIPQ